MSEMNFIPRLQMNKINDMGKLHLNKYKYVWKEALLFDQMSMFRF